MFTHILTSKPHHVQRDGSTARLGMVVCRSAPRLRHIGFTHLAAPQGVVPPFEAAAAHRRFRGRLVHLVL